MASRKRLESGSAITEISGRSKTSDLVDCKLTFQQVQQLPLSVIATQICKLFAIKVTYKGLDPRIPSFAIYTQSPHSALSTDVAKTGLFMQPTADGNLTIDAIASMPNAMVICQGNNELAIISASYDLPVEEFSNYIALKEGGMTDSKMLLFDYKNPGRIPSLFALILFSVDPHTNTLALQNRAKFRILS